MNRILICICALILLSCKPEGYVYINNNWELSTHPESESCIFYHRRYHNNIIITVDEIYVSKKDNICIVKSGFDNHTASYHKVDLRDSILHVIQANDEIKVGSTKYLIKNLEYINAFDWIDKNKSIK